VAIDSQNKREGKQLEILGYWNPREKSKKIDKKAYDKWISQGAQPSAAVKKLISK
jgi:small subunit ribosomal protein S16